VKNTNKKMIYALVAAVVIVVVVIVAGAYVLMNSGGGGGAKNTYTVGNATSLQIETNVTEQGVTVTHHWAGKNLNSTQQMLRLDLLGGEAGNYSYIFITSNQTAWSAVNGVWTDSSSTFSSLWSIWEPHWDNLRNELVANWSGVGDHNYTTGGASVKVYYVSVNPSLSDSLFQPNT
jgi:hypothetical protein